MQRWLLGLAVLVAGTVSFAHAEYIVIVANVGATKEKPPAQGQPGNPFGPGGMAPGGAGMRGGFGDVGGPGARAASMPRAACRLGRAGPGKATAVARASLAA